MPSLRNEATGVVVVVDDTTAATLGAGWKPVEDKQAEPTPKKTAPRSTSTTKK